MKQLAKLSIIIYFNTDFGERGGSVVEPWTLGLEIRGLKPTSSVLCP